jgi:hypothetical protein
VKIYLYISFFLSLGLLSNAQDNLGIAGSSRAPVNTLLINPSSIVDSRAFIDINLVGLSAFARNNFMYLPAKGFSLTNPQMSGLPPINTKPSIYNVYADVAVQGPGATFAVKSHAFGISTAVRSAADVRGIPKQVSNYVTNGFQYNGSMGIPQQIKNLRANALAWGEVGLSYGTIIKRDGDAIMQGGITVKRLFGLAGLGVRLDDWNYNVKDSTHLDTQSIHGEYGMTDVSSGFPAINGKGWGFDIGFTYKLRKSDSKSYQPHSPCTDGDYIYKIGVSILDIGKIAFKSPFYRNQFNQDQSSQWDGYAATNTNSVAGLDSMLNNNFSLVQQNSSGGKFRMKLPTGISVQADYNLGHNFYVLGMITYGLPRKNSLGVQRASYLGLAPRWEIKRLEVSLPLSLYEWKYPQVGLAVRLNSIVIGSDNLGWKIFKQDIYGADIYVSIKYTIFKHWKCKTRKDKLDKPGQKRGSRQSVPCPTW